MLFPSVQTLLIRPQEEHPICKKMTGDMLVCLSVCSKVQVVMKLMPIPPHHLLLH